MLARPRLEGETSAGYLIRLNALVAKVRQQVMVQPWALTFHHLYAGWAGHISCLPESSYIRRIVSWRNLEWFRDCQALGTGSRGPVRPRLAQPGRPIHWEKGLEDMVGLQWQSYAGDRETWRCLKAGGIAFAWSHRKPQLLDAPNWRPIEHVSPRAASLVVGATSGHHKLMFAVDCMQISSQVNGEWQTHGTPYEGHVHNIRWIVHVFQWWLKCEAWQSMSGRFFRQVPRRYNVGADYLCNKAMDTRRAVLWQSEQRPCEGDTILVTSDGGSRQRENIAACACTVSVLWQGRFELVLAVGLPRPWATNIAMVFEGASMGVHSVASWMRGERIFETPRSSAYSGMALGVEYPAPGVQRMAFV
jgi:hypothetical protein